KEKYGLSIMYITHDLLTAYYISDRIAIMLRGEIVETGPVEKVLTSPKHPYTMILRESVAEPDPRRKWMKRINPSNIESKEYSIGGCKFVNRCPYAMDICKKESPEMRFIDGRFVKCFLYDNSG
ncbi:MAG: oligopeptide/dipeptide ABC transporter ATP-binding protein, partial [Caldisericum sp.]|uniref:oligopeptide/dipeptide ABC transporter ATP-binding protein n=1 Tax=Caldisericum sp. TaxID=2499687 RepID=UPI003D12D0B1